MNKYEKKRKIVAAIISCGIYVTFVCFELGQLQSVANWNYNFHELLFLPLLIATYLIPILTIIWIYYFVRSHNKGLIATNRKIATVKFLNILGVIVAIAIIIVQSNVTSYSGLYTINEKMEEQGKYYIVISNENIDVKCSWNEFNLIEEGKRYLINFEVNNYWPEIGNLEYIEKVE